MAPAESWPDGDGLPPPPPPSHQDQLNRQMIRHLMTQYSHEEMQRIWQEETRSVHSDTASIFTSSTRSSVKSEDATSVFDSGSSIRTTSDSSSSRGSIISNVSAKFLGRKSRPSVTSTPAPQPSQVDGLGWDTDDAATMNSGDSAISAAPKQKGAFMCGFCKEEGIQKTCTRKNDLKRHIEDFHNMNAQWFCRHRGCQMVFDWQTAYKTHLKQSHGGSRMSLDDAKVSLCPQTVFACGFEKCTTVFEASTDDDAGTTFKDYVAHIVKHFDEATNSGEWTYSGRIRNLLRQAGVFRAWNNTTWAADSERHRLTWHPQTSGVLRKRLETRHIGDLQLLIQYVIMTGSDPTTTQKYREDFTTPVRDECQMAIPGHKIRAPIPATTAPMDAEPEFRISRGANPSLAAYLATQRRVYVPRPPVRSGRSARPPVRAMPSSGTPLASHFEYHGNQAAPVYDGRQQQQHHHHQQHPQYAVMTQPHGGIIADEMRNLRSMTGHASEADVEMGDAHMVDASYMSHSHHTDGFSSPYGSGAMHSSDAIDACGLSSQPAAMDQQHDAFVPYGTNHTY
ncbi:hypothetical protein HJFPF1_06875 [Paramyrothecium foliicola]|nr:hypothetical protein HJFPF1_06875 [Paramyrothecium foliicola]